jgi:hypothetical protein
MKALTKKYGEIEILSVLENTKTVKCLVDGVEKNLMYEFVNITNMDGSVLDFSNIKIQPKSDIYYQKGGTIGRKESKLANMIAEGTNYATFNKISKTFNNDGI